MEETSFYYKPSDGNNFYHVSYKGISHQSSDDYDFEFFYNGNNHVMCKLLLHQDIINILNMKIYSINFDENGLKQKYILTHQQKLNLQLSFEEFFPAFSSTININTNTNASTNQISTQVTTIQQSTQQALQLNANASVNTNASVSTQVTIQLQSTQQALQLNELRLFYQPAQNDDNFYHITCIRIQEDNLQTRDDDHDFEFFYRSPNASYHVTCKLLLHSMIINMLNKEIYGIDFDVNELNRKYILTPSEKFNLEQNLNQYLSSFIP